MQSFTTQSHQRNYQGKVVVENPDQMLARVHQRQKQRGKVLAGLTTSVMALAVAVTGSMLGATAIHNQQLKHQVQSLRVQATEVTTAAENNADFNDAMTQDAYYYPTTLELRPEDNTQCHDRTDEARHHPVMTLEARPAVTDDHNDRPQTLEARDEDRAPKHHDAPKHRRHGEKRTMRRIPVSDKEHDAQPLPNVERHHERHATNENNR